MNYVIINPIGTIINMALFPTGTQDYAYNA